MSWASVDCLPFLPLLDDIDGLVMPRFSLKLYIFLLLWNYSFHGLLLKLLMLRFSESFLKKGVW